MENQEGLLTHWEFDFIKYIDPGVVRKRLREEFDHLYSVGTLVDAIKNDFLMTHLLAYAWKSTYHLALVCKRFWIITKSHAYWTALAKHALKDMIPSQILNQVNFFYFHKETDPSHLFLQSLLKKPQAIKMENNSIEFYSTDVAFDITWFDDNSTVYSCYMGETRTKGEKVTIGARQVRVYFNSPSGLQKLVWNDMQKRDGSKVSKYHYCELYDSQTGLTWYGQPGTTETHTSVLPGADLLKPGPHSFGVWK